MNRALVLEVERASEFLDHVLRECRKTDLGEGFRFEANCAFLKSLLAKAESEARAA